MESNPINNSTLIATARPIERVIIDLKYINADQASSLIRMFDSPEAYAENFSAIKAISRGLYKIIEDHSPTDDSQISRMFYTVNEIQGKLMLDDMQEHERIISSSGLMPDPYVLRPTK